MRRPLAALTLATQLAGCSVFSPLPAWELLKAGGSAGSTALAYGPSQASQVIHHGDAVPASLCIEYNREAPAAELVPALQAELRGHGVQSRVYEAGSGLAQCSVWLRYSAAIQWGRPPLASAYKSYLSAATLSLHQADGRLMASSAYQLDEGLGLGRWATTRSKLAPAVRALLTGFAS